jgi:hypothetical protein
MFGCPGLFRHGCFKLKGNERFHPMDPCDRKAIRIQGIVTPAGWGEDGIIEAVSVATFDKDQYLVLKDEMTERMLEFLHEEVEVDGFLSESGGRKCIKIWNYRLI